MKCLLVGHGGSYNRGCEAIVRSTLLMLRREFKDPEITISTADYVREKRIDFGPRVKIIPANLGDVWKRFSPTWFKRQCLRIVSNKKASELAYAPLIPYLKSADAVISVGGDNYTLDYGFPDYFLGLNRIVKKYMRKLVIWGASIGPFPDDSKSREVLDSLKTADLITVRESISYEYLKSAGIKDNVKLTADPAFILPPSAVPMDDILCGGTGPLLGFNISPILARYSVKNDGTGLISESVKFLRSIINDKKVRVILIPHVTRGEGSENNDHFFMEGIYDRLEDTRMIYKASPDYNAMQMKYVIAQCDFFIGARTHATIAALSSGVPTISLGYSVKSRGINEDIFGNQDLLLDVKEFSASGICKKFMKMYDGREEIRKLLSVKIPELKEMAWQNAHHLKALVSA